MDNPYAPPESRIEVPTGGENPVGWKQILFSFQGRLPRRLYWAAYGLQILSVLPGLILMAIGGVFSEGTDEKINPIGWIGIALLVVVAVPLVWSGFAAQTKRWHDRNKSAWWILVGMIPYIGGFWVLIECGCLRGTEGPNQYGPDPT